MLLRRLAKLKLECAWLHEHADEPAKLTKEQMENEKKAQAQKAMWAAIDVKVMRADFNEWKDKYAKKSEDEWKAKQEKVQTKLAKMELEIEGKTGDDEHKLAAKIARAQLQLEWLLEHNAAADVQT